MRERLTFHMAVVLETIVGVVTLALIALAIFLFVSGSQIIPSNIDRAGVHLRRSVTSAGMTVSGSFVTRSDCTHVEVLTEVESDVPTIYLIENENADCEKYRNPLPYTFTASFDERYTTPIAVYMNGDAIATKEEY
jgi:hypothetical protein